LSRRALNPVGQAYDPDWPEGRISLTAGAFNHLGEYTSSPGHGAYCYAELSVFFPTAGDNHCQYTLSRAYPQMDGQNELAKVVVM